MKKLADYLKEGDVLMFRTVQDLSCDKDYAYLIYSEFIAKDIQLEFLYDPTCNFSIYRKDYINSPAVINNLIPQILTAALSIPVGRKTLGVLKGQKKEEIQSLIRSMSSEFDGSIPDKLVRQVIMDAFDIQIRQYQRHKKITKERLEIVKCKSM